MEQTTQFPPPRTLVDRLADIRPGHSAWFPDPIKSVRSTLTRLSVEGRHFQTRREKLANLDGVRVWRLT